MRWIQYKKVFIISRCLGNLFHQKKKSILYSFTPLLSLLWQPLDRDRPTGRARWELKVSATDGVHSDHAIVHVNVKDINDNAPFFPNSTINATVPENAGAGTEVGRP